MKTPEPPLTVLKFHLFSTRSKSELAGAKWTATCLQRGLRRKVAGVDSGRAVGVVKRGGRRRRPRVQPGPDDAPSSATAATHAAAAASTAATE